MLKQHSQPLQATGCLIGSEVMMETQPLLSRSGSYSGKNPHHSYTHTQLLTFTVAFISNINSI